jgi:hypothetical protein
VHAVIRYVLALKLTPSGLMQSSHADFATFNFARFAGTFLAVQTSPRNQTSIYLHEGEAMVFSG